MTKESDKRKEQQDAINHLRGLLRPGDTVYTVLRHVSRSGAFRLIDVYAIKDGEPIWLSGLVAKATGLYALDNKREALRVQGGGMDMGFSVVYNLSSVLYRDGFGCIGKQEQPNGYTQYCPSNDHSNGDRDYTPHCVGLDKDGNPNGLDCVSDPCKGTHWHTSGGYALRHNWM